MQDKIFDSCVYPTSPSLYQLEILREKLKKNKIIKAVVNIRLTPDKNLSKFQSYFKNQKLFYPTYHFHNKTNLKNQLQKFKKNKIKLLKIHPRFLKKKLIKILFSIKKYSNFVKKTK
jgi:prephenate dehydratase